MVEPVTSFRDFEHQGWSSQDVAVGYHDYLSPITTQAIGALLDAAEVGRGTQVVDVATGAGYAAAAAAERGAEVIGIDFSATQVALARRRYPSLEFREGDAGALPFSDGAFGAVVSNFGMPHVPDPDAAISEAFRVLRSGGRFAFSVWASPEESSGAWHHLRRCAEPWPNGCPLAARSQLFPVQRSRPVRAKPTRGRFPVDECVQGLAGLADGIAGHAVRGDHEGHRPGRRVAPRTDA